MAIKGFGADKLTQASYDDVVSGPKALQFSTVDGRMTLPTANLKASVGWSGSTFVANLDGASWGTVYANGVAKVTDGTYGDILTFTNDYAHLGQVIHNVQNFTISMFVRPDAFVHAYMISNARDGGTVADGIHILLGTTNISMAGGNESDQLAWINAPHNSQGGFIHVGCVWTPSEMHLYLNGELKNSGAPAGEYWTPPQSLYLGCLGYSVPTYYKYNGDMAKLRIYDRALNAAEISALSQIALY